MSDQPTPQEASERLESEISKVLIGNEDVIERLTISLLTDGHVLLEGVPGVAKTTIAELFARATGLDYRRIQLTPDSLPADIMGTTIYREETGEFEVRKGPVFANVVVADEINRATPKTQSALLEAMQEGHVTIEGESYALPEPFIVVATQNPIEMEGTFELPEAQRDRFQFKLTVNIPERSLEQDLLERFGDRPDLGPEDISRVIDPQQLSRLRKKVSEVHVSEAIAEYFLDIGEALREHTSIEHGPSPRALLALQSATKAKAAINGRNYVIPDDVKDLGTAVLAHRLVLQTDAALGDVDRTDVVRETLGTLDPPSASSVGATATASGDESGELTSDGGNVSEE